MAQFTIYRSTDTSAPTLSGTVGDLVNLLDKCLVTGYGSKTAAGWTKPYTGTNKAAFRQGTGSRGFYLRVQDDAPGAGGAREARLRGYETMSDVDTGTGLFPTAAQLANGVFARKSTTADATVRSWVVAADARTVYVFVQSEVAAGTLNAVYASFAFGDIYSYGTSDAYGTFIAGRDGENSGSGAIDRLCTTSAAGGMAAVTANYVARAYTQLGSAIQCGKHADNHKGGSGFGIGLMTFPNAVDGGLYLSYVSVTETPYVRGRLRGFYQVCHANTNFTDGDTFSGVGDFAGKTFLILRDTGATGVFCIETSNTLDSN